MGHFITCSPPVSCSSLVMVLFIFYYLKCIIELLKWMIMCCDLISTEHTCDESPEVDTSAPVAKTNGRGVIFLSGSLRFVFYEFSFSSEVTVQQVVIFIHT
jgi:hypothetical protein